MSDEPKRGRGRPRRAGADEEILHVALELLREVGFRAFTVDEVSVRTGIAKTTIYRRWPSKGSLIAGALAPLLSRKTDPIAQAAELLQLLGEPDGELADVLRAVLGPLLTGDRAEDREIGALLLRFLVRDETSA
jgi:AcrR family transcriptional regulator